MPYIVQLILMCESMGSSLHCNFRTVQLKVPDKTGSLANVFNIKDITCEVVLGSQRDYDEGKRRFCHHIDLYAKVTTAGVLYVLQEGLCDEDFNTFACDLSMAIVEASSVAFRNGAIPDMCEAMFEAVWNDCGGRGGIALLTTMTDQEIPVAGFLSVFYVHEDTATCPAHPPDDICLIEDF